MQFYVFTDVCLPSRSLLNVSDISTMGETRVVEDENAPRLGKFAGAQQALLRQATVSDEERVRLPCQGSYNYKVLPIRKP